MAQEAAKEFGLNEKDIALQALFRVYLLDVLPVMQDFFVDERQQLSKFLPDHYLEKQSFSLISALRNDLPDEISKDGIINNWASYETAFRKFISDFVPERVEALIASLTQTGTSG
jgi:hypothetical protein